MKAPNRVLFFLVHMETGQRYPVLNEDVVIGRTSGDILFASDMKLSNQHCRIVKTPQGLGIHDLGSANGTMVDGIRLSPEKVYAFKAGAVVHVGEQQLKLTEPGTSKKLARRKKKVKNGKKKGDTSSFAQFFVVVLAIAALYFGIPVFLKELRRPASVPVPVVIESPYSMVEKEMRGVIDQYKQIGEDSQSGRITDKQMTFSLRTQLLPAFKLIQAKLSAIVPSGEYEKRSLELNRKICDALLGQIRAMADNSELHNKVTADALKKYSDELETLRAQSLALKKQRQPAQRFTQ